MSEIDMITRYAQIHIKKALTLLPRCLGLSEYLSDILLSNASALIGEARTIPATVAIPLMTSRRDTKSSSFFFSFKVVATSTLLLVDKGLHVKAFEQNIPARVMIVLSRSFIIRIELL